MPHGDSLSLSHVRHSSTRILPSHSTHLRRHHPRLHSPLPALSAHPPPQCSLNPSASPYYSPSLPFPGVHPPDHPFNTTPPRAAPADEISLRYSARSLAEPSSGSPSRRAPSSRPPPAPVGHFQLLRPTNLLLLHHLKMMVLLLPRRKPNHRAHAPGSPRLRPKSLHPHHHQMLVLSRNETRSQGSRPLLRRPLLLRLRLRLPLRSP